MMDDTILGQWQRDQSLLSHLFSDQELQRINALRRQINIATSKVVLCVYENQYAKSGGIFAVAENLPQRLRQWTSDVLILSPLHRHLQTVPDLRVLELVGQCKVEFGSSYYDMQLRRTSHADTEWILMDVADFFDADGGSTGTDPYAHKTDADLLRDSLFASAAIPHALMALGLIKNIIIHVQDWQFASAALTVKQAMLQGQLESVATVLTCHNPYDSPLPREQLSWITDRSKDSYWPRPIVTDGGGVVVSSVGTEPRQTVYERMIPLMDGPISTVSRNFAKELLEEPLHTEYFADHLQGVLRLQGLIGIDNGLFGSRKSPFSEDAIKSATRGEYQLILTEKLTKRDTMLDVLEDYEDSRIIGRLDGGNGRPLTLLDRDVPVFMMFGRMDPGQKGFDVFIHAIECLPPESGRFMLAPIVTGFDGPFISQLEDLAASRQGEVAVYPFRMEKGYMETMAGASFIVMPSLYEPFGGATEAFLAGTPVVARRTGGLVHQVIDYNCDPDVGTGLLFREQVVDGIDTGAAWKDIQQAGSPTDRMAIPLYRAMVAAMVEALTDAARIHQSTEDIYGQLLSNLFVHASRFSWSHAARLYTKLYSAATN